MTKSTSVGLMGSQSPSPLPRRRRGRIAKLPKMTNSERGKYYRKKNKQHAAGLEESVARLRKQVRDLEQFVRVRDELAYRNPYDVSDAVVAMIFDYFVRARDCGIQYDASFARPEPVQAEWFSSTTSEYSSCFSSSGTFSTKDVLEVPDAFLFFDLLSFHVQGATDAPVVVMRGLLHTKYTRATIDRMFPHLIHYQELFDAVLDQEARYPCTYHFYFGSDGEFYNKTVEADYVNGLQQVVGNLEDVVWLLDGSHRYVERRDSLEEVLRGPSAMALEYILT